MRSLKTIVLFLFSFVFSLIGTDVLHAESLNENEARNAATQFLLSGSGNGVAKAKIRSGQYLTLAADNQNGYYVFNRQDGGIVIVADDDALGKTVLGYTTEGSYDPENLPLGLQDWFKQITVLMDAVHAGKIDRTKSLAAQQGNIVVDALIKTKWNQHEPFNDLCPVVDGKRCLTGCVATAMAQILYYWKWPEHGYGSVEYTAKEINQNLSLDLSKSYYDWDNMLEEYTSSWDYNHQQWVPDCTNQQATAVATLMRDCGYSVHMDYGLGASGGSVSANTLIKYFKYSPLAENIYRNSYSDQEWHQMLQNELDNKRPVLYDGFSETGGHQFILDGYDTDDFYHVNWGWGGYQDGWFILTDLNSYNTSQSAIISVEPIKNLIPGYKDEAFTYTLSNGVLTIKGSGMMPEEYSMETAPWRTKCQDIKKIVIGEGIVSTPRNFGNYWYYDDETSKGYYFENLEEVILPDGLLAIDYDFIYNAPLKRIDLPSTIQKINSGFSYCRNIKSLHLPKNLKTIEWSGQNGFAEITIDAANPYFIVKDNVLLNKEGTRIILAASAQNRLVIPENVETISPSAVNDHQASIIIAKPETAPMLPDWGFYLSKQTGILYIKEGATGYDTWLSKLPKGWFIKTYTDESQIPSGEFSWTLEDSVLTINGEGFMPNEYTLETAPWREQCQDIKKIVLGKGILSTISRFGYYYDSNEKKNYRFENLEEVILPEGLLFINDYFVYNAPLQKTDLPSSLQSFNSGFAYCFNLMSLNLPKSLKEFQCYGLNGLAELTIDKENPYFMVKDNVLLDKEGTKIIFTAAATKRLVIPENVTEVYQNAISSHQASIIVAKPMTAPTLPDWGFYLSKQSGFLYIKAGAKGYDAWLSMLPEGWKIRTYTNESQIPSGEFSWTLENGILTITGIGEMVYNHDNRPFFENRSDITKIKIEEGITNLGWATFWVFGNTSEIELPSTMKNVESQSFGYSGITKIVCLAKTAPQIWGSFVGMPESGVLQVLEGCDYSSWLAALPQGWTIEYIKHPLIEKIANLNDYLLEIKSEGVKSKELDANKDGKLSVSDLTEMVRQINE